MTESAVATSPALDPAFLAAVSAVPPDAWSVWFGDHPATAAQRTSLRLVESFALPSGRGVAALCLFDPGQGTGVDLLRQAALRLWNGAVPHDARTLHQSIAEDGSVAWTLTSAWSDPELSSWLREALSAGATLRSGGWEWIATPERSVVTRGSDGSAKQIAGRRHEVIVFEPGAVAIVYARLTKGAQPELDLLRHLERVPGMRIAPPLLGSAIIRAPDGQRSASAVLEELMVGAATVRSVLVARLRRALDGDPSLQATALDDVRAVGVIARSLHAALGRPFEHGVLTGAFPASISDVESWVARAWSTLTGATVACRGRGSDDPTLLAALELLPGKLQQFGAAAEADPGLLQRIHGNLRLDTVLMSPPRMLCVVEFDGDGALPDVERVAPQSPWRDVARMLVSLAEAAAEAAGAAGGDPNAFEIAWLWEREARKACLEGYGTGGGALHALLAIFEMEFASRLLLHASATGGTTVVASHTLRRLTRTIV